MNAKEMINEAISLPVEDRALIVESLLQSLNHPEEKIDKKWTEAARRRLDEMRSGSTNPVPGDEIFTKIWKRFHE